MARINIFWSYSRELAGHGASDYCKAMQAALNDALSAQGGVHIFQDIDRERGIHGGARWDHTIVDAVSSSVLFFWFQSPRWFSRPVCLFELRAFQDRVSRIAARFQVDPDTLLEQLISPIRGADVIAADWNTQRLAPAREFREFFERTNVEASLYLPMLRNARPGGEINASESCMAAAPGIKTRLLAAIPELGQRIDPLLDFIEEDRAAFTRKWMAEAKRLDLLGLEAKADKEDAAKSAPARVGSIEPRGRDRKRFAALGLDVMLVTQPERFWLTETALRAASVQFMAPATPLAADRSGRALWPWSAIPAILDNLRSHDLHLPNPGQAAAIASLAALPLADQRALGLGSLPPRFWVLEDGAIAASDAQPADALPVLLVSPAES